MILKIGKSKTLTFKKYSAQKSAHFNKTADFSSLKTLNGVEWLLYALAQVRQS